MAKHSALFALGLTACVMAAAGAARAADIVHTQSDASPIAKMVTVPGGATTYYLSGMVAPVSNPSAPKDSIEAYGDTKTQTVGVLNKIKGILEGLGLGMGDVVKMQVFLVNDARSPMDFKGFMDGYTQFFGGDQPNLPARSVVGVAALANPGFLVEIEVIAVAAQK